MSSDPDYELFRRMSREERFRAIGAMSAHEKAELVRTQIRVWIDEHRLRLTPQQIAVLEENIDFVRAELYERPRSSDIDARKQELIARTASLLDLDQMAQAFMMVGPDVPEFSDSELELAGIPAGHRIDLEILAARVGAMVARVRIYAAERIVAEREIEMAGDATPDPMKQPPLKRVENILPDVREERVRITVTPMTPGFRIWAVARVRNVGGETIRVITPEARS
jgi:hypothetical protein